MEHAALSKRITETFLQLSPRLQQAARHVLDRPDDVALMSMRRVAANAGVQPSTMIRLARAFGCANYTVFREPFQQRLRARPADYLERARELQARGESEAAAVIDEVLEAAVGNLGESFKANGTERFLACAEVLGGGDRVFIAGRRSCFPIAHYFHYIYSVFRTNSILLDGGGGTFADRLRGFTDGDVLLAISFDPYSYKTVQAADYVKRNGGSVVVITDSIVSPLVDKAEHTLLIRNDGPSIIQSVAPAIAAVEALAAVMMLSDGAHALKAVEESERQLQHFDAFWNQPRYAALARRRLSQ